MRAFTQLWPNMRGERGREREKKKENTNLNKSVMTLC